MAIPVERPPHLVVCVMGAWGHVRPMLGFLARLERQTHGGVITVITSVSFSGKIEKEWSRHFSAEELKVQKPLRIRFLEQSGASGAGSGKADSGPLESAIAAIDDLGIGPLYSGILDEAGMPHPTVFLTEAISATIPQIVRKLSRQPIDLLIWLPTSMNLIHNVFKMAESLDETHKTLEAMAWNQDIPFGEAANQYLTSDACINSLPVEMPDLPPMSGYELFPQEPPFLIAFGEPFMDCMRLLSTCDGIVTSTSHVVEPKGCQSVARTLQKRNGHFFAIGPLDVAGGLAKSEEIAQSEVAQTVEGFLDNVLKNKGPKTLLYISFDSLFGPTESEKFNVWVEVVSDMEIPLILVVPPGVTLTESVRDSTDTRLICKWAPQQFILSHPATGGFLTHNGSNGTHESLSAGVPMISWPISSDQPIFAMLVEQVLKVGFELNEVRRGHGLQARLSNGATPTGTLDAVRREAREVLASVFFDKHKRVDMEGRLQAVQAALGDTWSKTDARDGPKQVSNSAIHDLKRFIDVYLPKKTDAM